LYRGTRDDFGSSDFHSKCDGLSNTLTIFKAKQSEFIFGGLGTVDYAITFGEKLFQNIFLCNQSFFELLSNFYIRAHHKGVLSGKHALYKMAEISPISRGNSEWPPGLFKVRLMPAGAG